MKRNRRTVRGPVPTTAPLQSLAVRSATAFLAASVCVWAQVPPLAAQSAAQSAAPRSAEDAQQRLDATRQQLQERRSLEKGLAADVGQLRSERDQLNQSLVDTARLIQKGEAQLTGIEQRMGELEVQEKLLRGSLSQRHDSIARLLAAMQRMGRNPPPVMITRREDALQMVRSAMVLAAAFPELRGQALALAARLEELARVMGDIKSEGDKLKAETTRLNESRTSLALLMETKRQTLAERQVDLDKVRREAAEIAKNVNDLNELITRLDRAVAAHTGQDIAIKPTHPAIEEAGPGNAEAAPPATAPTEIASASPPPAAVPLPAPSEPPPNVVLKAPAQERPSPERPNAGRPSSERTSSERPAPAIEIAPKGTQTASLNPGRLKPAMPFVQTKGQLQLPAQGRRVLAFGEKTQYGGQSKGMVLETRLGGQVTAPADAWVVFAGEFRSFGQLLIMNAGDGYHLLLAGLSQIDVQVGEFVLAGQPVGVMSGPAKGVKAKSADASPVLYIEFRKDSRPIDPAPWWAETRS